MIHRFPGACQAGRLGRVASRGSVVSAAHGKTSTAGGEFAPKGQAISLARPAPLHQCSPTRETDPARSAEGEMPSDGGSGHHTGTPLGAGCAPSMDGAQ